MSSQSSWAQFWAQSLSRQRTRGYALSRNPLILLGTGGRTRTDTGLTPPDFESGASTSFTTPAKIRRSIWSVGTGVKMHSQCCQKILTLSFAL